MRDESFLCSCAHCSAPLIKAVCRGNAALVGVSVAEERRGKTHSVSLASF